MPLVRLQRPRMPDWRPARPSSIINQSKPFAESRGGRYTHRVRSAVIHECLGVAHVAVHLWCGMTLLISKRHNTRFCDEPGEGRPICATCEGRAIGAGQCGAREIAGREVMFSPRG